MNRALPLLLLILAIAGGLGYAALRSTDAPVESSDPAPARNPESEPTDAVPSPLGLAPVGQHEPASSSGHALKWDIIPMNRVGQVIGDARITATLGREERTASGRTKWTDAEAGDWAVVIESDEFPTWRRVVTLVAAGKKRTVAYLSDEIRIDGTVVDTFGEPVADTDVFLLSRGTLHPTRNVMPRTGSLPAAQVRQGSVPIHTKTSASGQFRLAAPEVGSWRLSVGPQGDARWTQPRTSDLSHGGPDKVTVTIPAAARLTVEFPGSAEERPRLVRAYGFDAAVARRIEAQNAKDSATPSKSPDAKKDDLSAGEERGDIADGGAYDKSNRSPATRLFEPGWVMVQSVPVDVDGHAVLVDMPGGEDLRFLFIRNRDRTVTSGSYRLAAGKRSVAQASLPPAGSIPAGTIDRRSSLAIGPEDLGDALEQEPGVHWTY